MFALAARPSTAESESQDSACFPEQCLEVLKPELADSEPVLSPRRRRMSSFSAVFTSPSALTKVVMPELLVERDFISGMEQDQGPVGPAGEEP